MRSWIIASTALALAACAGNRTSPPEARSPADPWEPINRPIYAFNQAWDTVILKPVAKGYEFIVPAFLRRGVTNFSRNLRVPLSLVNNLLQGKGAAATNDAGRFLLNSTFGLLGIFDFATIEGFDFSEEDFGQTLAVWGVPNGPFIVIPLLGPSTVRDGLMIPPAVYADPLYHYDVSSVRDKLYILRYVDVRQRLFAAEELIKDSPDKYITVRESYLQRREYLIHDGNPPVEEDPYEDLLEEDEDY